MSLCKYAIKKDNIEGTGTAIVGISCSEGNTTISQWLPGGGKYEDIVKRCNLAKLYLENSIAHRLGNVYMVWFQGESDGDIGTTYEQYYERLDELTSSLVSQNIVDKCFIIQIGDKGTDVNLYDQIQKAQVDLCEASDNCVLISDKAKELLGLGLMKDEYHYTQEGYNILGEEAGTNAANYTNSIRDDEE